MRLFYVLSVTILPLFCDNRLRGMRQITISLLSFKFNIKSCLFCTPGWTRTSNLRIRSALLYPIELWVQLSGRVKPPHHLRAGSPASFSQLFFRSLSGEVELPHHLWAGCPTSFSQLLLRLYFKELYKDTKYSLNIQIYFEIF